MSEEKNEFDNARITPEGMVDLLKETNKDSDWSGDWWVFAIIMLVFSFGLGDTKDHELRERVARLEGQMDMIRR